MTNLPDQCAWGIDVSYAQAPGSVDWHAAARLGARYGIARLTNGVDRDAKCEEHCAAIRQASLVLGAYAFWIPWRAPADMLRAFLAASQRCAYGVPGDLLPWLDCESWPGASGYHRAVPGWAPLLRETLELFRREFGGAVLYVNHSDWVAMGSPDWIGEYPLASAHYTSAAKPLTAGGLDWAWWQDRVEPIAGVSAKPIDHSWARLPLLTIPHPAAEHAPPQAQRVSVSPIDVRLDVTEHNRLRNLATQRATEAGKHG